MSRAAGASVAADPGQASQIPEAAPRRRLAANYLYLAAGECAAKLLTFIAFSYLARTLGPERYGNLEFTLALMVFFTLPADLGLGSYGAREIAKNKSRAASLLREITGVRLLLVLCSMAALGVLILVIHKSVQIKLLLSVYGFSLLATPALLQWFFQGHDRMRWIAAASITRQAVFVGTLLVLFRSYHPLYYVGLAECASVTAVALLCLFIARRQFGVNRIYPSFRLAGLAAHLRQAIPIGLAELTWAFTWYSATVLLGFLVAGKSLGWFGASHRALVALHTFIWLYFFNLLPSISRCVSQPRERLLELIDHSLRLAAWGGGLLTFGLTILSHDLLVLVYGRSFEGAAGIFSVLLWMLPITMIAGHYRYILIAYNQQDRLFQCSLAAACTAIALGFLFTIRWGALGAAWALVIANLTSLALLYLCVRRYIVRIDFHRQLLKPLAAVAICLTVDLGLGSPNRWVGAAAVAVVYLALFVFWERAGISFVLARSEGTIDGSDLYCRRTAERHIATARHFESSSGH